MPAETANEADNRPLARFREREQAVGAIADRQHGVVVRAQLLKLGFEEGAIARRVAAGRLHEVQRGVYAPGRRALTREGRWMAAVLASGPEAVLSHWSAAALWMIRPNSRSTIDVTTPRKSRSWDGIKRHHSPLPADERTIEEGIPVTTVPRTILDLAATEPLDTVENLLREMEHRELWDRLSLWNLIERYPGKRGVRKVRAALGPKRFQVDCHWPNTGQIVELDGWRAPDPHRLPRRPRQGPHPPRRRLFSHPPHLEPAR